jgi:hypothetical protein
VFILTLYKKRYKLMYTLLHKLSEYGGLNWQGYEGLEIYITKTIQKFISNFDRKISREWAT